MSLDFLRQIGYIWDTTRFPKDLIVEEEHTKAVQQVVAFLTAKESRSVVISGEPGVGKTTLIDLVCKELDQQDWHIFVSGSTDLVAGQRYIGDLEQQVRNLCDFLQKSDKKWLWIVPRFHELYYVGKHEYSPMGILDMILPHIEAGRITVIGETQPRHYERVLQFRPQMQFALEQVRLQPEDTEYAIKLAEKWIGLKKDAAAWKKVGKPELKEASWMARQYLGNQEEPGNLLNFLKLTAKHFEAEKKESSSRAKGIQQGDFISALAGMTGLPLEILDDRQKLDLEELRNAFQDQVMGQEEAVDVLTERIAMIKAGLTDPTRPAGVFLFVGPTGTGKTEIAKTLADFMFGSPDRMIRLDMSEFQTADSMHRIFGGRGGDSVALVDQIRKNPFSVILLDEFEKSHPNVWDLFLQVFDDGRMTDPHGDTADFRHAIIIMTSNLGAGVSSRAVPGFKPDAPGGYQVDKVFKELEGVFRPEFLNRIDRVVAFKPLSRGVVRKILRNELKKVLQRRGFRQRRWAVEWEDSALEFLMDKGFSETLGARPMKRAIEQYLLAPLALAIVNHQFPEGEQFLFIKQVGDRIQVDFVDPEEPHIKWTDRKQEEKSQREKAKSLTLRRIAFECVGELAEREVLVQHFDTLAERVDSDVWIDRKEDLMEEMAEGDFWDREDRFAVLSEIEYRDRFEASLETAESIIERLSDHDNKTRLTFPSELMQRLAERLFLMEQSLRSFEGGEPQDAFVRIWTDSVEGNDSDQIQLASKLRGMYEGWARKRKMQFEMLEVEIEKGSTQFLFAVSGFAAFNLLRTERGIHVWEEPAKGTNQFERIRAKVDVVPQPVGPMNDRPLLGYAKVAFNRPAKALKIVRRYRSHPSALVRDFVGEWRSGLLGRVLEGDWDLMG